MLLVKAKIQLLIIEDVSLLSEAGTQGNCESVTWHGKHRCWFPLGGGWHVAGCNNRVCHPLLND